MRLAIVGASARAAAFSALAAGHEVVAADLFADSDLAARCPATKIDMWPDGFPSWLAGQQIDGWMYTGGLENHPEVVDRLASARPLLGNGGQPLRLARTLDHLAWVLEESGCHFPQTIRSTQQVATASQWLAKSASSAGGLGVAENTLAVDFSKLNYLQHRVHGHSISAAYVAAGKRSLLLGITEQLIGRNWTHSRPFQYAGSIGPLNVRPETRQQIVRAGEVVAQSCNLVGLIGIDFVVDAAGGAWAVDVNPRYTASMEVVQQSTGVNMVAAHLVACNSGVLPATRESTNTGFHGKAYVFARCNVQVGRWATADISDVPAPGTRICAGQPVCTVFANGEQYGDVEPALRRKVGEIRHSLYPDEQEKAPTCASES